MSRIDELAKAAESINNNGGMDTQEWIAFWLADIAVSLARIVDSLEAEKGKINDGSIEV